MGTLWYIWKVPEDGSLCDLNKSKHLIENIASGIVVYHTREMQRQVTAYFGLVCTPKQSVLLGMYQFLTNDKSATSIFPESHIAFSRPLSSI